MTEPLPLAHRLFAGAETVSAALDRLSAPLLPSAARLVFIAVLLPYFWASALTKIGPGLFGVFHPTTGAYAQIFPRAMEAVGFDASQLGLYPYLVTVAGTAAEFLLPLLIALGLLTRPAALVMMGFVLVQSLTDVWGHGVGGDTLGRLFDRDPGSLILDQRLFWMLLLTILLLKGGGPLALDRAIKPRLAQLYAKSA